jgi:hypothetical protein
MERRRLSHSYQIDTDHLLWNAVLTPGTHAPTLFATQHPPVEYCVAWCTGRAGLSQLGYVEGVDVVYFPHFPTHVIYRFLPFFRFVQNQSIQTAGVVSRDARKRTPPLALSSRRIPTFFNSIFY